MHTDRNAPEVSAMFDMSGPGSSVDTALARLADFANAHCRQRSDHVSQPHAHNVHGIVCASPQMRAVVGTLVEAVPLNQTILITGENGTGKELVAGAIHHLSPRAKQPFVAINCAALPPELMDSGLFGYVRGAFTDAYADKTGHASS